MAGCGTGRGRLAGRSTFHLGVSTKGRYRSCNKPPRGGERDTSGYETAILLRLSKQTRPAPLDTKCPTNSLVSIWPGSPHQPDKNCKLSLKLLSLNISDLVPFILSLDGDALFDLGPCGGCDFKYLLSQVLIILLHGNCTWNTGLSGDINDQVRLRFFQNGLKLQSLGGVEF